MYDRLHHGLSMSTNHTPDQTIYMYDRLHHGLSMSTNTHQTTRYTCTIDYITGCPCRLTHTRPDQTIYMYDRLHHGLSMSTNTHQTTRYTCTIDYITGCPCRLPTHQTRRLISLLETHALVYVVYLMLHLTTSQYGT